jgi:hypothetical protein
MEQENDQKNPTKPKRNIVVKKVVKKKVNAARDEEPSIRLAYQVAGGGVSSSLLSKKK